MFHGHASGGRNVPDAQRGGIESYCAMMGIKLVRLCQDVMSGGKDVRSGLRRCAADSARLWRMF